MKRSPVFVFVPVLVTSLLVHSAAHAAPWQDVESVTESAVLRASDGAAGDFFGQAMRADGTRVAVGARGVDLASTAPGLPPIVDAGAVYIFEAQLGGGWAEVAKVTSPDPAAGDAFGAALDMEGDRLIVGAYRDDQQGFDSGAAYIFERDHSGQWVFMAELAPQSGLGPVDYFGLSVALDGGRAIVGAPQSDMTGFDSGAAYVFELQSGPGFHQWLEVAALPGFGGRFGDAVALDGEQCFVGAPLLSDARGLVYEFRPGRTGVWSQSAIHAGTGVQGARFGSSLAIDDALFLIGAPGAGLVSVWQRTATGGWTGGNYVGSGQNTSDGHSVAASESIVAFGGYTAEYEGTPSGLGTIRSIDEVTGNLVPQVRARPSAPTPNQGLGVSAAVVGDLVLFGAHRDGVAGPDAGAVYVYEVGTFYADPRHVSLSTGGVQNLLLRPRNYEEPVWYLVAGSLSGSQPGVFDPLLGATIPLNPDAYTTLLISTGGAGILDRWFGITAWPSYVDLEVRIPPSSAPSLAGLTLTHACLIFEGSALTPIDVTNPVELTLVP